MSDIFAAVQHSAASAIIQVQDWCIKNVVNSLRTLTMLAGVKTKHLWTGHGTFAPIAV